MKEITVYITEESLGKLVDKELRERLEMFEADDSKHSEDIAFRKEQIPALRIVIDG